MTPKLIVMIAGGLAAVSVAAGAFGAHALADRLEPRMLEVWETAARYNMYHALGLFIAAWLAQNTPPTAASITPASLAAISFIVGIVLFSGSLYTMALTGVKWLGAITPIGGVAFIVGWIACAVAGSKL